MLLPCTESSSCDMREEEMQAALEACKLERSIHHSTIKRQHMFRVGSRGQWLAMPAYQGSIAPCQAPLPWSQTHIEMSSAVCRLKSPTRAAFGLHTCLWSAGQCRKIPKWAYEWTAGVYPPSGSRLPGLPAGFPYSRAAQSTTCCHLATTTTGMSSWRASGACYLQPWKVRLPCSIRELQQ